MNPTVMYILVNRDLKMSKGKVSAQVGHGVGNATETILLRRSADIRTRYFEWKAIGYPKITLSASQSEMEQFLSDPEAEAVRDEGRTQIPAGSLTVVVFYPSTKRAEQFAQFKLF